MTNELIMGGRFGDIKTEEASCILAEIAMPFIHILF
jgi:hypothetical protein